MEKKILQSPLMKKTNTNWTTCKQSFTNVVEFYWWHVIYILIWCRCQCANHHLCLCMPLSTDLLPPSTQNKITTTNDGKSIKRICVFLSCNALTEAFSIIVELWSLIYLAQVALGKNSITRKFFLSSIINMAMWRFNLL